MFSLIKYELKKICKYKSFFIIILILIFANFLYINASNQSTDLDSYKVGKMRLYEKIKGQITSEKINLLNEGFNKNQLLVNEGKYSTEKKTKGTYTGYVFGDASLFKETFENYRYAINYADEIKNINNHYYENLKLLKSETEQEINKLYIETYVDRSINYYYDFTGMNKLLNYNFSSFLIIITLFLLLIPIFCDDFEQGNYQMIFPTKIGPFSCLMAKLISSLIIIVLMSFIFYFEDFLVFNTIYPLDGWFNPIYSIKEFSLTLANYSVLLGYIYCIVLKIIGFIFIGSIAGIFAVLIKKTLPIFIILFIYILIMISNFSLNIVNPITYLQPYNILGSNKIFRISDVLLYSYNYYLFSGIAICFILLITYVSLSNSIRKKERRR